jgi:alkaline phosphatase D
VASGDPLSDRVILWTRFVPQGCGDARIRYEVAEDELFRRVVARGDATVRPERDFCVKVDAGGLQPGRRYVFRFLSRSGPSVVGHTRTAPERGRDPLTIAAFACAYMPIGYFRAYADAAAREDVDLCAHTGDYIYEYGLERSRRSGELIPGREWAPDREIVSYADYCARYASYRSDPDLQELHRVKPFVHVWDDHEFTNDAWRDGAQNHQPDSEGPWSARRDVAARAWFDWLPVRAHPGAPRRIHHTLKWGELAHVIMLDSRLHRDNQPPAWTSLLDRYLDGPAAAFDAEAMRLWREEIGAAERTVLGAEQETWLAGELRASRDAGAPWQILVEGSVLGRFQLPPQAMQWLGPDASEASRRSTELRARVGALGLPYDTPLWSGFPAARDRLLAMCARDGANVAAFGGETHCGWAFNLPGGRDGGPAAVEIACTAVTSSNGFRNGAVGDTREAAFREASPEIAWCDVRHYGYHAVRFEPSAAHAEFIGFASVATADAPVTHRARLVAEASSTGVRPWAPG